MTSEQKTSGHHHGSPEKPESGRQVNKAPTETPKQQHHKDADDNAQQANESGVEPSKSSVHKTASHAFVYKDKEHHSVMARQGSIEDLAKERTTEVHSKHGRKDVRRKGSPPADCSYTLLLAASAVILLIVILFFVMLWGMFRAESGDKLPKTTTKSSKTIGLI
ncbi:hypothetical protein IscW_ISCW010512 [Ixodes scapularis]|uniref:Uncharacterized protein n=1 Tax=Ixodes scapularis TaxID=6945 RepID=B7Q8E1_IXOSC|nr:hypothetical protein IscW_ISCW010512 [Ixodes scapularis]|eukprot:XP_002404965.1 hypothetical protein IscW_ISCW010512 [Ixodes scapularis]